MHRAWKAEAWIGTAEQLIRVQGLLQDSLARAYTDAVTAVKATDEWSRELEIKSIGSALRLEVKVSGSQGRMIRTGELSAIVAEMDLAEIEDVEMNTGGYSDELPRLSLQLARKPKWSSRSPVEFSVSGPDRHWVGGLNDALQTELRKGVPWWSVFRRTWAAMVLAAVPILGILIGLVLGSGLSRGDALLVALFGIGLTPILLMTIGFPLNAALKRLFPGFEVLEPGAVARGRQVLAATVTAVSFAVGVIGLIVSL